jgi:hypothetical protein
LRKIRAFAALSVLLAVAAPVPSQAATPTTLYFHSTTPVANLDHQAGSWVTGDTTRMSADAPTNERPSVALVAAWNTYPKESIYGPAWTADMAGSITGPASVSFWATSAVSSYVAAHIYIDGNVLMANRRVAITASNGPRQYTVNFANLNITMGHEVIVQLVGDSRVAEGLGDVEILYDSPAYPSSFTFNFTPATSTPPPSSSYAVYRAPESFKDAHGPNETSIGMNPTTGAVMFQMSRDTAKVTFDDSTTPATSTWWNVSHVLTSQQTLDPYLYTDRATGRTFVSQLLGEASVNAYSDDDGATWTATQPPSAAPSFDHESLSGGPYASDPVIPNDYGRALYYCAQGALVGQCARSDDGGSTWGAPVPFTVVDFCAPSHGRVTVGPDGTVYVPVSDCGADGQGIFISRDNGTSWEQKFIPGTQAGNSDPALALDADGRLYYAAASGGSLVVSTSTDSGANFADPVDVGALAGIKQAEFASAVAGDAGRAAVAFYGSTTPGNDQDANYTGAWHLYVATTIDGGETWSVVNATPGDPVQRGWICMSGLSCDAGRNLLDFQSITVDPQGRVIVGFADGCTTPACIAADGKTGEQANSTDSWGSIARQQSGPRLYAAFDPVAVVRPLLPAPAQ